MMIDMYVMYEYGSSSSSSTHKHRHYCLLGLLYSHAHIWRTVVLVYSYRNEKNDEKTKNEENMYTQHVVAWVCDVWLEVSVCVHSMMES